MPVAAVVFLMPPPVPDGDAPVSKVIYGILLTQLAQIMSREEGYDYASLHR